MTQPEAMMATRWKRIDELKNETQDDNFLNDTIIQGWLG